MPHRTMEELEQGLERILQSPTDDGRLEMIVRRPETDQREVLEFAELDEWEGLVGDNWIMRGSTQTPDGAAHPEMQLNLMNARVIDLVAMERERWSLAGDQLYVDLSLSDDNLPPGTRLTIGEAEIEVTAVPHLGCNKFTDRYGADANAFVNSERGRSLNLRGINAKVVRGGAIKVGDRLAKRL